MLGRETEWRQGHLLTAEHATRLNLPSSGVDARILIATHDCDLPNDSEENIEVLVGRRVDSLEVIYAKARNPRRLHLKYERACGAVEYIEVLHSDRLAISKLDFVKGSDYCSDVSHLNLDDKRALKQWLAARYGRPAFPNSFENRLRCKVGKHQVERLIGDIAKKFSEHLVGLFFDLGEERGTELAEEYPYYLSINVAYDATEGGADARVAAEQTASRLRELFEQAYGTPDQANSIVLENCTAISDTKMTLADLRKVDQWRLEYVSLSESPPGVFVAQGSTTV